MSLFFEYDLPPRLIAQTPADRRDHSRLMVLDRHTQSISHHHFHELPQFLRPSDLLVLNDTKVLPARLIGKRESTGGKWEGLFLTEREGLWKLLAQTRGSVQPGERCITDTGLTLELVDRTDERHWLMRPLAVGNPAELLAKYGEIPLPPYIRKGRAVPEDAERYQTVYARETGSVAAPTAGLHFTPELFANAGKAGHPTGECNLARRFRNIRINLQRRSLKHSIHAEYCTVAQETIDAIQRCKANGGRVIAVGTTTTRALETAFQHGLNAFTGESKIYIHPPYQFQAVDCLITNFHLPRTTLLLLVQALSGSELLRRAYEEAIREEYRFFSYGDAMLIV